MSLILLAVLILAIAAFLAIVFTIARPVRHRLSGQNREFKARELMTPNELEFLVRLEAAVPEYRFHSQVCMGAILDPVISERRNPRLHRLTRWKYSQKIIDFVAQNRKTGKIVAIIELDDRSHLMGKDQLRDAMLHDAGYKTVRWESSKKPTVSMIRRSLLT